ncbi:unnamed protein product [Acanthoscelides obtectus]|uniref:C2H2-type domain-containing protein n=1 Tax=Acanthoscelides obtectus TaxID=200917 RepID=A0A9P0K4N9_ACAOB|nr:unnamed protein product [Acanthoscelides obtectus]CAK1669732.1 Longitudinals lacking protein, isoforms A/B/D/L [Acanthoscelides obtectus]
MLSPLMGPEVTLPPGAKETCKLKYDRSSEQKRLHHCSKCGNTFTRVDNLKRHQKYVCGMPPQFQCILCSYATKHKYVLAVHMKSRHPDVIVVDNKWHAGLKGHSEDWNDEK